jgi:acetamidase/formamidase/AraC-like DNA-binding protein
MKASPARRPVSRKPASGKVEPMSPERWAFRPETYAVAARRDAWSQALARLAMKWEATVGDDVAGTLTVRRFSGSFTAARLAAPPQIILATPAQKPAMRWLAMPLEGDMHLAQNDRRSKLAPDDVVFGDPSAFTPLVIHTHSQLLFLGLPDAALRTRMLDSVSPRHARLPPNAVGTRVLAGLLRTVAETMDDMQEEMARPLETTLLDMLAQMLTAANDSAPDGAAGGALRQGTARTLQRIRGAIEQRLGDPTFTIADVAAAEGTSVRYVQKLFERNGENFLHFLRMRRLERAREDLTDPAHSHLSISDICFRWGFNDAAHFSRAFHDAFGVSPRNFRRAATAEMADRILQHANRGWPEAPRSLRSKKALMDDAAAATTGELHPDHGPSPATADQDRRCTRTSARPRHHHLAATETTIHWGYFSRDIPPVLEIDSGDLVTVETLSQHAYDDYDRMVRGDSGAEGVFHWTPERKAVDRRGAGPMDATVCGRGAGEGFGVHICTGPIAVRGARPNDLIELQIVDIKPRLSANPAYRDKAFGSNAATWWGFQYGELASGARPREVITIYEVESADDWSSAKAVYSYHWTPQTDPCGVIHHLMDYPGVPVDRTAIEPRYGVLSDVRIPVRPHFGVMAVAPREPGLIDSVPPGYFGGNIDNWRAGKGTRVYLPVNVPGALLSVGDPHLSQGDGEVSGTAIECSLTGVFRVVLHKRQDLASSVLADVTYPLIETKDAWIVHGFSYSNYLVELGEAAQSDIYKKSSLDLAMRDAFRKARRFLMTAKGLSEDEAISLMSAAVDFGITQVADGNWGVHALIRKALFPDTSQPSLVPISPLQR